MWDQLTVVVDVLEGVWLVDVVVRWMRRRPRHHAVGAARARWNFTT